MIFNIGDGRDSVRVRNIKVCNLLLQSSTWSYRTNNIFLGLVQRHPTPRKSSSVPFFARIALSTFQGPLSVLFMKSKKNSKMNSKKDSKKISVLASIRGFSFSL